MTPLDSGFWMCVSSASSRKIPLQEKQTSTVMPRYGDLVHLAARTWDSASSGAPCSRCRSASSSSRRTFWASFRFRSASSRTKYSFSYGDEIMALSRCERFFGQLPGATETAPHGAGYLLRHGLDSPRNTGYSLGTAAGNSARYRGDSCPSVPGRKIDRSIPPDILVRSGPRPCGRRVPFPGGPASPWPSPSRTVACPERTVPGRAGRGPGTLPERHRPARSRRCVVLALALAGRRWPSPPTRRWMAGSSRAGSRR